MNFKKFLILGLLISSTWAFNSNENPEGDNDEHYSSSSSDDSDNEEENNSNQVIMIIVSSISQ